VTIVRNEELPVHELPGLVHRTLAGHAQGLTSMEVWRQVMAPGATTPVHRHACEEVIHVLSGRGRLVAGGETSGFEAGATLIVPPDRVHQLVNDGDEELELVAVLGAAPVRVCTAEGERLPLPWDAPGPGDPPS
jgi:quercetin dioxygenase-like cupin family protein